MPELPEVETMRRGILSAVGCQIERVEKLPTAVKPLLIVPSISSMSRRIVGREIVAVERIGKRVIARLESEDRLIFEPRMTGLVLVADPPSKEHLRFRVDLSGGVLDTIWYWDRRGLGSVKLFSPTRFEAEVASKFGPDALAVTSELLRDRLRHSRRPVKVALLDQKAIAGIGNLYASEILNVAGVHPTTRCDKLTIAQWRHVHQATLDVLHAAIEHEGSTLSDGTYRNALNDVGGYQNQHRVYDRTGELCRTCEHGTVQRIVQAQRSTFFCPKCQSRGRGKR
ncbi:MAG: bifunctional DNA-formamidopyrimidine glycosylase/DNA-(apurinic or apyrimidinic site) lyase [Planctomycetaceae bacterium]|nr:bifunctional DNA-formamidopyrimidine glycosylase/DNA-(apurinic or apyrimidinic site) lyase [Planctomycetales bacterium]MCB9924671.1 bifunctional DNA-formamidopyrimidine glycosylase/DNA-(apurinic or apyrimidinic site) lyase [Planctomycetaceae bacterium]